MAATKAGDWHWSRANDPLTALMHAQGWEAHQSSNVLISQPTGSTRSVKDVDLGSSRRMGVHEQPHSLWQRGTGGRSTGSNRIDGSVLVDSLQRRRPSPAILGALPRRAASPGLSIVGARLAQALSIVGARLAQALSIVGVRLAQA